MKVRRFISNKETSKDELKRAVLNMKKIKVRPDHNS